MKILVIFTGGTIGSSLKGDWVSIDNSTPYTLLSRYKDSSDEFVAVAPYSVLSENLSALEINALQKEIKKNLGGDYDGIIVTHGTDTLQYTACAIEYAFGDTDIPIVFVSADYPLENENTNGFINFESAVEFIRAKGGHGVFVSYKNDDKEETDFHIPSRMLCHAECSANIYSVDDCLYGSYNKEFKKNMELTKGTNPLGVVEYTDNSGILCVESYPANSYSYSLDGIKAVVLRPYHSATLNTASKELASFCAKAEKANIPVFLVNAKNAMVYESAKEFDDFKINVLPYGTFVSSYMKIWAAISLKKDIKAFMQEPITYEIV